MTPHDLRQRRTRARLTQRELSEAADVPRPHISAMEAGRRVIGPTTGARLERALSEAEARLAEYRERMDRAARAAVQSPRMRALRMDAAGTVAQWIG